MDFNIQCPYCLETFSLRAYIEDGKEQDFIYDCEICCHPLDIKLRFLNEKQGEVFVDRSSGI